MKLFAQEASNSDHDKRTLDWRESLLRQDGTARAGKTGDVRLQLPAGATSATETDLMERPVGPLPARENAVEMPTKPYEIKTVEIGYAGSKP